MSLPKTCPNCAAPLPDDSPDSALCAVCEAEARGTMVAPEDWQTPVEQHAPTPFRTPGFNLPAAQPQMGTVGDFEVIDKLGQGGMGAVYRARQISLGRIVALKVLPQQFEEDEDYVARFQREAKVAASLNHPNLVRVYSSGQADGCHFIAMELIEGENLRQRMKREPVSMSDALRICADVARALQCGWDTAQLIHRDIKPANIYLSNAGEVKLGDLGLAKSLLANTTGVTQTGTSLGTPLYMSPEQGRGDKQLDFRSDIYSLGCTLYELLTGKPPYEGRDGHTIIHQHLHAPLPAILKVLPSCPMPLVRLVGRMLKKFPRERHPSYDDLIAEMELVREQLESGVTYAGPSAVVQAWQKVGDIEKEPAASYGLLWAGLLAVVVVGAGVAFFALGKNKKPAAAEKRVAAATVAPSDSAPRSSSSPSSPSAAPVAVNGAINLLPTVQLSRDVAAGEWSVKPEGLSLDVAQGFARCEFPYEPPDEYDFEVAFTPKSDGKNVDIHLRAGGSSFMWKLNAYGRSPAVYSFSTLDGANPKAEVTREGPTLEIGRRYTTRVEVRRTGLRAFLDGRELVSWSGDFKRFSKEGPAQLRDERHLGVGSYGRSVLFHRAEVRPFTGAAPTAPSPTATSAPANSAGFRSLFDGRSFAGWKKLGGGDVSPDWSISEGAILGGNRGSIVTQEQFADFELTLEWRVSEAGNGGIFYHVPPTAQGEYPVKYPEFQLCGPRGDRNWPTGSLFHVITPTEDVTPKNSGWNRAQLIVVGGKAEHWINEHVVCRYDFDDRQAWSALAARSGFGEASQFPSLPRQGGIVLQSASKDIAYRNIRIRSLERTSTAPSPANAPQWQSVAFAKITDPGWSRGSAVESGTLHLRNNETFGAPPRPTNGAVRATLIIDESPTGARVVTRLGSSGGQYYVSLWPGNVDFAAQAPGTPGTMLRKFPITTPFKPRDQVTLQLASIGHTHAIWLNGQLLGTVEDDKPASGGRLAVQANDARFASMEWLDLDGLPEADALKLLGLTTTKPAASSPSLDASGGWIDAFLEWPLKDVIAKAEHTARGYHFPSGAHWRFPLFPVRTGGIKVRAVSTKAVGPSLKIFLEEGGFYHTGFRSSEIYLTYTNPAGTQSVLASKSGPIFTPDGPAKDFGLSRRDGKLIVWVDGRNVLEAPEPTPAKGLFSLDCGRETDLLVEKVEYLNLDGPRPGISEGLIFRGHRYQFVPGAITWPDAKAKAEQMGGHLVTITSKEEDDFIKFNFGPYAPETNNNLLIGGFRDGAGWKWVTGEPFTYTGWLPGCPDGPANSQFLQYWRKDGSLGWDDRFLDKDSSLPGIKGFIVEWEDAGSANAASPPPANDVLTFAGHRYQIVSEAKSWEEAREQAAKAGGHLATVTTAAEDQFIRDSLNRLHPTGNRIRYWIGAASPKGTSAFAWITGEPFAFTAWGGSEPDESKRFPGKPSAIYYSRDSGWGLPSFAWADAVDTADNRTGYIVEWDTISGN